jgi:glutathione synthase/RimK-type ligase-like ATP-grasp enzyme
VNEQVEKLAQTIGVKTVVNSSISELANNKLKLKKFLQKAGLPVVE